MGSLGPLELVRRERLEPVGAELVVRTHPSRAVQLELGPSLLRYRWADVCSECTGTFAGVRAVTIVGQGIFSMGPPLRLGRGSGNPAGGETGSSGASRHGCCSWGEQGRVRLDLRGWSDLA